RRHRGPSLLRSPSPSPLRSPLRKGSRTNPDTPLGPGSSVAQLLRSLDLLAALDACGVVAALHRAVLRTRPALFAVRIALAPHRVLLGAPLHGGASAERRDDRDESERKKRSLHLMRPGLGGGRV